MSDGLSGFVWLFRVGWVRLLLEADMHGVFYANQLCGGVGSYVFVYEAVHFLVDKGFFVPVGKKSGDNRADLFSVTDKGRLLAGEFKALLRCVVNDG